MGIIIGVDIDRPDRSLDTPAGDADRLTKRIGDYLGNLKSEEWKAKAWSGREARNAARAAGLPVPEIDNTADIRARVPEEMYPPLLIADNNVTFQDYEGGIGYTGPIVSQAFRDAVESLDKDVHQFVPVEIRRKDGGLHERRPFYFMRVTRLLNTINLNASPQLQRVGGKPTDPVTDTTTFHLGHTAFAVHADRIAGMGLWRDVRSDMHIFASQPLVDLIKARGLTGWRAWSTFTEL
ncbi:imm11 family protein [Defluviimonas salinarum]|uniref:Immunity MXAN-0049 protein domain-containing protein n=1 Tax=Defluviimonas salinarum TaxID=2992147 RepID=A0ABT3IXT1_9RHOB|nr:DUF1629 domain-containing protein [Defluviimonas salinarum]MCW3780247.1 hypothetical protein [Defluviimonas salinarum]